MTSVLHRRTPCDALRGVVDDISQQRFSMSIETLRALQKSLLLAHALVQEAMNARCSIDRLPPELLSHIFTMVPSTLPQPASLASTCVARNTYELIPLTHVCRRWRAIALDASSLWATICETSSSHFATTIFRARARHTPLTVYLDGRHASTALADVLVHDAAAVTELRLYGLQDVSPAQLASELLASPALSLEHAVIRCRPRYGGSDASAAPAPVTELWGGIVPRLKTLELHDVPFLPSNHFQILTSLALSWENTCVEWTLPDLFELLAGAPSLEHIALRGLPSDLHLRHPPVLRPSPPVAVPHLRTLEIGDCRGTSCPLLLLRLILAHLVIPNGASVRLYGLKVRKLSGPPDLASAMSFAGDAHTRLAIDMTYSGLAVSLLDLTSRTSIRVELGTGGASKTAVEDAIAMFIDGTVSASVRELVVRSQRAWRAWCDPTRLLALLPQITALELQDLHLVADVLSTLRPSSTGGITDEVLSPQLETLRLTHPLDAELVRHVAPVLKERTSHGARPCSVAVN